MEFLGVIILILLVLVVTGVKIISQSKAVVVERLGAYHRTMETGLHYVLPIIERSANTVSLKEIVRDFAKENLIYSNTLKEWITHNGVDIKADKASVVVSACDGKVSAINNDPRYGLTVIIEHNDGYKTVYSNLLTAEFVVEGEEVKAGQTIGTIGNSANFEIADDYHLHFELIKDGKYIDPVSFF